jgi:hypothetical protein
MKEKVYTFRHHRYCYVLADSPDSESKVREALIQEELKRGYYPVEIKTEKVQANGVNTSGVLIIDYKSTEPIKDYFIAHCWSAYAGKKTALKLWEKEPNKKFSMISNPYLTTPKVR